MLLSIVWIQHCSDGTVLTACLNTTHQIFIVNNIVIIDICIYMQLLDIMLCKGLGVDRDLGIWAKMVSITNTRVYIIRKEAC